MRLLALLGLLLVSAGAHAQQCLSLAGLPFITGGNPICLSAPPPVPLQLPLATESSSIFTFLGSFKVAGGGSPYTGVNFGAGAMSVNGSTLYLSGLEYDPADSGISIPGIAAVTIPALNGTAAYNGSNAGVPCTSVPCTGSGVIQAPVRPLNYVAAAPYTLTATPTGGITSATFSGTVPAGIAGNAGWYIGFENAAGHVTQDLIVKTVSGSTVTFAALAGGTYTSTVSVHQFEPIYPFGGPPVFYGGTVNSVGDRLGGTLVEGSDLLISGGTYFDGACNQDLGWIVKTPLSNLAAWGAVNNVAGQTNQYSRRYMGSLGNVPSMWQRYLGGNAFVALGIGTDKGSSIISCQEPIGFNFTTFDATTVSSSAHSMALSPVLDYFLQGSVTSAYTEQLLMRSAYWAGSYAMPASFAGPLPIAATQGYPATLSATPSNGDTTESFTLPSGTVTATANITNTNGVKVCSGGNGSYCYLNITSISSGTISNSGISYTATGTGLGAGLTIVPASEVPPGTATGVGYYQLQTSLGSPQTGITVTLTPKGYFTGYYQITFDGTGDAAGNSRIVHLAASQAAIPSPGAGTQDFTTLATLGSDGQLVSTPLGGSGYSSAVTVLPYGDNFVSEYDGPFGTAFIEPGSRSLLVLSLHQYGPVGPRNDACNAGASSSNEIPLSPDSSYYRRWQITAYDLQNLVDALNGTGGAHIWTPSPYAIWSFPGEATLHTAAGCLSAYSHGWATYDPVAGILYATFSESAFAPATGQSIIYEWRVAPL